MNLDQYLPFPSGSEGNRLVTNLIEDYGIRPEVGLYASELLHQFARGVEGLTAEGDLDISKIAGQRVLDIGCGSGDVFRTSTFKNASTVRNTEPWLCRLLAEIGADVTGVDKSLPTKEFRLNGRAKRNWDAGQALRVESGWKLVRRDLIQAGAIDANAFPSDSFDVVFSRGFIGSDLFGYDDPQMTGLRLNSPTEFKEILSGIELQIRRALKPDGVFIWNDRLLRSNPEKGFDLVRELPPRIGMGKQERANVQKKDWTSEIANMKPEDVIIMAFTYFGRDTLKFTEILNVSVMGAWQKPTPPPRDLVARMTGNVSGLLEEMQEKNLVKIEANPSGEPLITIQRGAYN